MSLTSKLRDFNRKELASLAFYAISGIIMLVSLPLTGFPPHLGFLGIFSLIVAYMQFKGRSWAPWLVGILFVAGIVFSLYTLYAIGFSNALISLGMIAYAALTLYFSLSILLKRSL